MKSVSCGQEFVFGGDPQGELLPPLPVLVLTVRKNRPAQLQVALVAKAFLPQWHLQHQLWPLQIRSQNWTQLQISPVPQNQLTWPGEL